MRPSCVSLCAVAAGQLSSPCFSSQPSIWLWVVPRNVGMIPCMAVCGAALVVFAYGCWMSIEATCLCWNMELTGILFRCYGLTLAICSRVHKILGFFFREGGVLHGKLQQLPFPFTLLRHLQY